MEEVALAGTEAAERTNSTVEKAERKRFKGQRLENWPNEFVWGVLACVHCTVTLNSILQKHSRDLTMNV